MSRTRAVVELSLAALAALGCVASWLAAQSRVVVAPIAEGEPSTTSTTFYAPLLVAALALLALAGVLVVVGTSRWRRLPAKPVARPAPR